MQIFTWAERKTKWNCCRLFSFTFTSSIHPLFPAPTLHTFKTITPYILFVYRFMSSFVWRIKISFYSDWQFIFDIGACSVIFRFVTWYSRVLDDRVQLISIRCKRRAFPQNKPVLSNSFVIFWCEFLVRGQSFCLLAFTNFVNSF
jgi:hypothetical protein